MPGEQPHLHSCVRMTSLSSRSLVPSSPSFLYEESLSLTGVLRGELCDPRPVELLSALRQQREEAIAQQAGQRHRYAQRFRGGQGKAYILLAQRCGKSGRFEL